MTEKEIAQSLRICSRRTDAQTCTECPLFDSEDCMGDMMIGAADLIERLTAENTALREGASLGKAKRPQKKAYEKSIEFLRALTDGQSDEIKRLRRELEGKNMVIALAQRKQAEAEAERDALREKQRWIPVTERLPDERDAVIILLKDGQVFRGEIRKRIALPEWWYFYDASDTDMDMLGVMYPLFDDGLWLHENPVVAWMPLPEAPEGGEKA